MSLQIAGHGVFLLPGGVCRRVCTPVRLEGVEPDAKNSDDRNYHVLDTYSVSDTGISYLQNEFI